MFSNNTCRQNAKGAIMNVLPINNQPQMVNNKMRNDNVSFKKLNNVYTKGFKNPETANRIVEWFKNNKYVNEFLKNNDVDLYLTSKRKGKRLSLKMDIQKYIETSFDGKPYREMTYNPFNVRSLIREETVTSLPEEKHFSVDYSVRRSSSEESLKEMQKYLDQNTDDVYKPYEGGWGRAPDEILDYKVPHIAQDIFEMRLHIDSHLSGCGWRKN